MTQLEKIVAVMGILAQRFPRMGAKDMVDLSTKIIEKLSTPPTKITEKKPVFDTGSRSGT